MWRVAVEANALGRFPTSSAHCLHHVLMRITALRLSTFRLSVRHVRVGSAHGIVCLVSYSPSVSLYGHPISAMGE